MPYWNFADLSTHLNITLNIAQTCITGASPQAFIQIIRSLSSPLICLCLPVTLNAFVIYVFSFYREVALLLPLSGLFSSATLLTQFAVFLSFIVFFSFFTRLISVPLIKIGLRRVYCIWFYNLIDTESKRICMIKAHLIVSSKASQP